VDVRLRAEMKDVGLVGGVAQLPHEVVDRGLVREVREVHLEPPAQVPDVVEGAARRRAHEGVDVGAELDERIGQVRAHESVGTRHENGASGIELGEVGSQAAARFLVPDRVRCV
jgi:hypothetical protein